MHLTDLVTSPEQQQLYVGSAAQAQADFDAAQQRLAQAINLKQTQVRSPVKPCHCLSITARSPSMARSRSPTGSM
jgi:hypothetical protein